MSWFKVAAVAFGALIVWVVVSAVIGFVIEAGIAVLVVAAIVLGIKAAFYKRQLSESRAERQVRGPAYDSPPRRRHGRHVEDELARLKREMGH